MDFSEYREAVGAWIKEVLNHRGHNAAWTLKCCHDIEQYALKNKDKNLLGFAYYYIGETCYLMNNGKNLFSYMSRAVSCLDQSGQWELVARAYNIMAITSLNRGNAPIAMDYYLTGLECCREHGLTETENIINLNLGNLYQINGQYEEARKYYETARRYTTEHSAGEDYYSLMACIHASLGRCYLLKEMYPEAKECVRFLDQECREKVKKPERLYILCFKVHFYHASGQTDLRDECIRLIHKNTDRNMPVMDTFEDFFVLCRLLLEIGSDEIFWDIIHILEDLAKQAGLVHMQRRILSLKIKCYRRNQDNASYLKAAGLYYELSEIMERENRYMVANMLHVRRSLEQANELRREMEQANERLLEKSETDPLTRMANRSRLNDYSENAFERALKNRVPLAVEILDIDYFKEYNDNYGHQAGDECIKRIAGELKKMSGDKVFCARYGGDEFIILYEDMTREEVLDRAEDLRQRILDLNISHSYSRALPVVTVSQGICHDYPKPVNKCWDFLHAADLMLYQVKKESRNDIFIGPLDERQINIAD